MMLQDLNLLVLYIVLFVFGLVFGSFGNVVIWRLPRKENLSHPGSHCPRCDHIIRWYDDIPIISWLVLRAKCRDCGEPISGRYPLVELLSGIIWMFMGIMYGFNIGIVIAIPLLYILLLAAFMSYDGNMVPISLITLLAIDGAFGIILYLIPGTGYDSPLPTVVAALSALVLMLTRRWHKKLNDKANER